MNNCVYMQHDCNDIINSGQVLNMLAQGFVDSICTISRAVIAAWIFTISCAQRCKYFSIALSNVMQLVMSSIFKVIFNIYYRLFHQYTSFRFPHSRNIAFGDLSLDPWCVAQQKHFLRSQHVSYSRTNLCFSIKNQSLLLHMTEVLL